MAKKKAKRGHFVWSGVLLLMLTYGLVQSACAYWQQEVHYKIEAEFFPKEDKIMGRETLIYTNNSPDTLTKVFFHLYLNAFQPGSPMDLDERKQKQYWLSELPTEKWGKMEISRLELEGKESEDYRIDYTVMEVALWEPLLPGEKTEFYLEFEDKIPPNGARTGKQGKHYDIGQWYPKIAVYDHQGWHNYPYLGTGEFYGDFGKFEVNFTAPKEYIIGHTGKLSNESELFPDLPKATDDTILVDILKKHREEGDSAEKDIMAEKSPEGGNHQAKDIQQQKTDSTKLETRTWKMYAENVHDFFIVANPDFIWDRGQWEDVTVNILYTKDSKGIWERQGAEDTKFCLKFLSEKFGRYPYKQFTSVAGTVRGGMEYPQIITMSKRIGGKNDHRFFSVLAHEAAHNWFYGLIGNNETRQACLDEGFASLATILLMEARYGRYDNSYTWTNWLQKTFYSKGDERTSYAREYLKRANQRREEPVNTHSDRFVDPGNYRLAVYSKTADIMFMLQYTLGDSLFDIAVREYFKSWHWKHPYLADFQAVMEEVSGMGLDWFFDQWFEKTWTLDYGITKVKSEKAAGKKTFLAQVGIKKNREAVMPLDLHFKLADGSTHTEKVPVEVWFDMRNKHQAYVPLPAEPVYTELNPDQRLMDVNRLNNVFYSNFPIVRGKYRFSYNFLNKYNPVPLDAYQFLYNPSLWYNDVDGLKSGIRLKGSYLEWSHNLNIAMWMGPMSGRLNYQASLKEPTFWLGSGTSIELRSFYLDGRKGGSVSVERNQMRKPQGREYFKPFGNAYGLSFYSYKLKDVAWLPPTVFWEGGDYNFLKLYYDQIVPGHYYDQEISAYFSTNFFRSDYEFNKLFIEYKGKLDLRWSHFWSWRVALGYANGNLPAQDAFYLASASPLDEFDNLWYRSRGSLPNKWRETGEVYLSGGGNVRGYTDLNLSGKKLFAFNLKWWLPNYLKYLPVEIPYLSRELNSIQWDVFYDFGSVWSSTNPPRTKDFFHDLGVGLAYKLPYLDQLFGNSYVRFDFPIWLDKPDVLESHFKFRWRLSIGTGVLQ